MKKKILPLLSLLTALICCIDQNYEGCPSDMYLTFSVEDPYEPTTYDARLASDVMLYIFKEKRVVSGIRIPYHKISAGKEYVIRKNLNLSGDLDLVAWAVPVGHDQTAIPHLSIGNYLYDIYRRLNRATRGVTDAFYQPANTALHLARISTFEPYDVETRHDLKLNYSDCRIEVRVTDNNHTLSQPGNNPEVFVYGTTEAMDMDRKGAGNPAIVVAGLESPTDDHINFTTGRFGVLPSPEGQTVSVKISDGVREVATLAAPKSAMPQGAVSGGFILFEYTLNASEFTLTINGFRQNIVVVDNM